jgi:sortase A
MLSALHILNTMSALPYVGKFLISVGVGILLFVGWTLKGTDLYTNREQGRLTEEFSALAPVEGIVASGDERLIGPPEDFEPDPGDPVFRLSMPSIDTRHMVVEGVDTERLRLGPGHYPSCRPGFERPLCTEFEEVWPGEKGRVVVSGHRTTYGAPFWALDKLENGDELRIEAKWGNFVYEVTDMKIVQPDSLAIAVQSNKAEIVLTTCNPKFSAAERLIIFAELVESTPA